MPPFNQILKFIWRSALGILLSILVQLAVYSFWLKDATEVPLSQFLTWHWIFLLPIIPIIVAFYLPMRRMVDHNNEIRDASIAELTLSVKKFLRFVFVTISALLLYFAYGWISGKVNAFGFFLSFFLVMFLDLIYDLFYKKELEEIERQRLIYLERKRQKELSQKQSHLLN